MFSTVFDWRRYIVTKHNTCSNLALNGPSPYVANQGAVEAPCTCTCGIPEHSKDQPVRYGTARPRFRRTVPGGKGGRPRPRAGNESETGAAATRTFWAGSRGAYRLLARRVPRDDFRGRGGPAGECGGSGNGQKAQVASFPTTRGYWRGGYPPGLVQSARLVQTRFPAESSRPRRNRLGTKQTLSLSDDLSLSLSSWRCRPRHVKFE